MNETRKVTEQVMRDNEKLRIENDRLRVRLAENEQALLCCHQYMQSCFDGWKREQLDRSIAENTLASEKLWRRTHEAEAEMGQAVRLSTDG